MHLYNVTLVPPSAVTAVCVGNFSPISKEQLILTCRGGSRLELGSINKTTGKYATIMSAHGFGTIRSLTPFRLTGGTRDYVVVGSDSGRIVVLEFDPEALTFRKIHQETFGKSGARRIVAGQYITADPKGRAIMIGAIEKSKMCAGDGARV